MHLTVDIAAALIEASAQGRAACHALGLSPVQVAYQAIADLAATPGQDVRDAMVAQFCEAHGLLGVHSERDFATMTEHIIEHAEGGRFVAAPFEPKRSLKELAEMTAAQRELRGLVPVTPEQVMHVTEVLTKASLVNGLRQRLSASDPAGTGPKALSEPSAAALDREDRMAQLARAFEGAARRPDAPPSYVGKRVLDLRDTIDAAFDMHSAQAELREEAGIESDTRLRELSNL